MNRKNEPEVWRKTYVMCICVSLRERKSKSKTLSELEIVIEVEERIGYSDRGK